jgi:hypothetical protein
MDKVISRQVAMAAFRHCVEDDDADWAIEPWMETKRWD